VRGLNVRRLVFVEECGTHTSMARRYARAPKGERAYGNVPRNRGPNTTLIDSMTLEDGMGEAMAVEGSTTGRSTLSWASGMEKNNRTITLVLCFVFGAFFLVRGFSGP
jgi:hypothetical protein